MDDDVEVISVLRQHLEGLKDTIDRALGKSAAEDMVEHYRTSKSQRVEQSIMTQQLVRAYERIRGYLGEDDDDELS